MITKNTTIGTGDMMIASPPGNWINLSDIGVGSKRIRTIISVLLIIISLNSVGQTVNYSSSYFGPNAFPVPEFTDATIAGFTTINVSWNYYSGFGDQTLNPALKVEIPLIPSKVSFKIWGTAFEYYNTTITIRDKRASTEETPEGVANGDIYIQTRILLLKEQTKRPSIVLNSTLKTASGNNFNERRYFDTPGYYFDLEMGKTVYSGTSFLKKVRLVLNVGFLCWETTNSEQNDAPLYGTKLIFGTENLELENSITGYSGWMNNGDKPLVYSIQLMKKSDKVKVYSQYQYGIRDFPYHHFKLGISLSISALTPKYAE
jgi:hypothetical protein